MSSSGPEHSLSQTQHDYLVQCFQDYVDPFIRILHKPRIVHELNQYRRGTLENSSDFECHMDAIYALALIPLTDDDCQFQLGAEKPALMRVFKDRVESGLRKLKVASSTKMRDLQTFLLYIVSIDTKMLHHNSKWDIELTLPDTVILDWRNLSGQRTSWSRTSFCTTNRHSS